MKTAKLSMDGQSQVVQSPKEFRFEGGSAFVIRLGSCVVLIPKDDPWRSMFEATRHFTDDFMDGRDQGSQADRAAPDAARPPALPAQF